MRRIQYLLGLCMAPLVLVACTPQQGSITGSGESSELENVQWSLVELEGAPIAAARGTPTISLSSKDQRASGLAGCNRFSGGYELSANLVQLKSLAMTRMACPDMSVEAAVMKSLEETASWKIDGRQLELFDATGKLRSRWTVTAIESGVVP
jgi:heat shock protein HslJ